MTPRVLMALLLAVVAAVAGVVVLSDGDDHDGYEVAAIFDNAKGMLPGQQMKIAGAVAGSVDSVGLTSDQKARVVMSVDRRFAPFKNDAECQILPEGLISENYVDCHPGSEGKPDLSTSAGPNGSLPTVPVEQTAAALSLQDLLNVFSAPTSERVRLLVDSLGIGTAGRSDDMNSILRRANPALRQARNVLGILGEQNVEISQAVADTDAVLGRLADRDQDLELFIERAATVARTGADHKTALSRGIQGLPAMLDALQGSFASIDRFTSNASPLLNDLSDAAPGLERFTRRWPALTDPAIPALRATGSAAETGEAAVVQARRPARHLGNLSRSAVPAAKGLAALLASTRDQGALEGIFKIIYGWTTADAPYDRISHAIPFMFNVYPTCIAENVLQPKRVSAGKGTPGCSHAYTSPGQGQLPANSPGSGGEAPISSSKTRALLNFLLK